MSLLNIGNTCFLSTALQCIICNESIDRYIRRYGVTEQKINEDAFINEFISVHLKVRDGTMDINPTRLYAFVFQKHAIFGDNRQHDCHEAVLLLLNMLAETFNPLCRTMHNLTNKDAIQSWCPDDQKHNIINEIFKLQTVSIVQCESCGHRVERYQCEYSTFWDELLLNGKHVCLDGYKCDACNNISTSRMVSRIIHFPITMIVQMRNFTQPQKDPTKTPPFEFTFARHVYTLYAVCKYYAYGNGKGGGHYTACVKNSDGTWTLKNDNLCMEFQIENVLHNACILFYDRNETCRS
jgi:ubiquitin C-terminal hydrolase